MKMTAQQSLVFGDLERVQPNPYKLNVRSPMSRWKLDEKDCTNQISGLIVRGFVTKHPILGLVRTADLPKLESDLAQRRQRWSPNAVDVMRENMMSPVSVHCERRPIT